MVWINIHRSSFILIHDRNKCAIIIIIIFYAVAFVFILLFAINISLIQLLNQYTFIYNIFISWNLSTFISPYILAFIIFFCSFSCFFLGYWIWGVNFIEFISIKIRRSLCYVVLFSSKLFVNMCEYKWMCHCLVCMRVSSFFFHSSISNIFAVGNFLFLLIELNWMLSFHN